VGVSVAYNFQTGNNRIKLLKEHGSAIQSVLFVNAALAALTSVIFHTSFILLFLV
jgi:hypothetical protein